MALTPCKIYEDALADVFKYKIYSKALTANQWGTIDITKSDYIPISLVVYGGNAQSKPPFLVQSGTTYTAYVICDASVTVQLQVTYIKADKISTIS